MLHNDCYVPIGDDQPQNLKTKIFTLAICILASLSAASCKSLWTVCRFVMPTSTVPVISEVSDVSNFSEAILTPLTTSPPINQTRQRLRLSSTEKEQRTAENEEAIITETKTSDIELIVVGSGSCSPNKKRGVSCTALRVYGSVWLFDVGEGTQLRLQHCPVQFNKIDKIFITHAHGDHSLGLPGVLCEIGGARQQGSPTLEIYGPPGLRNFLRAALAFTEVRKLPAYVVHELQCLPNLRGKHLLQPPMVCVPVTSAKRKRDGRAWGEVPGSRDIRPEGNGTWWTLVDDDSFTVSAAPVHHTVPCVGYIVTEKDKPGKILLEIALPKLEANRELLSKQGVREPRSLLKKVKALGHDGELALPNGDVLRGRDVLTEMRRGRKVVLLGDCCNARMCEQLARGADLLVHEATNAYIPSLDEELNYEQVQRDTVRHGHSTPEMAGDYAKQIGAKALLLTHFSQRYSPDDHRLMHTIASQAARTADLPEEAVATAYDSMVMPIYLTDHKRQAFVAPSSHLKT